MKKLLHTGLAGCLVLMGVAARAQTLTGPAPQPALRLDIPHSRNPLDAYRAATVAQPNLANSPRVDGLVKDGVLELSLKDAIQLALENNLDLAIARYNIPIARADILRTEAGATFRGVNTGVVQNTPGGGSAGLDRLQVGLGQAGLRAERAGRVRVRQGWCSQRWGPERLCLPMIQRSLQPRVWNI